MATKLLNTYFVFSKLFRPKLGASVILFVYAMCYNWKGYPSDLALAKIRPKGKELQNVANCAVCIFFAKKNIYQHGL